MRTEKEKIELYESIYNDDMLWFILGSLISSDSFIGLKGNCLIKKYRENITRLKEIIKIFPKTNIPDEHKNKVIELANSGLDILISEHNSILKKFETNNIINKGKYKIYK